MYRHSSGFIVLGTALAIFLILSFFSIFLLRFIVNENTVSTYNLLDIRARNLSISGLEHGIQLFKETGAIDESPIEKTLGNGNYTFSFNQSLNQNGAYLPYSHFTMLQSTGNLNNTTRNTRVFLSSYPDAFNLAYFGDNTTFSESGSSFSGDIYSNGNLSGLSISGTAYTSSGSGGTIHPSSPPDFPSHNKTYFQTLISEVPIDSSAGEEEIEEDPFPGWPVLFTNCNQTGNTGPSTTQVSNAYTGTNLDGNVTVDGNGIQSWEIDVTGDYVIEAYGASGNNGGSSAGNASGGNGAYVRGTFSLSDGDILKILVGQQGGTHGTYGGGGGGGTFVIKNNNTVLMVAGGGGGGGGTNSNSSIHGSCSENGKNGFNGTYGYGGTGGGGGNRSNVYGGAGGGYSGDGSGNYNHYSERGRSFLNGGGGGGARYGGLGGFGGGAGGYGGGGGGGGYSGGGGGGNGSPWGAGGGGGSYNSGIDKSCTSGHNNGHGRVVIGPPGSYEPGTVTATSEEGGTATVGTPGTLPTQAVTFTNANTTGRFGPSQAQINSAYNGTELNNQVTVNNGIQKWVIPVDGTYTIKAYGAKGGGSKGGKGASMSGDFDLLEGEIIYILVGQHGLTSGKMTSGGGGTFVVKQTTSGHTLTTYGVPVTPLIIAGGGGGSTHHGQTSQNGTTSTGGQTGYGGWGCCKTGGSNGHGGQGTSGNGGGGGGGGFYSNGTGYSPGVGFLNGGAGGVRNGGSSSHINGGFGGGGGSRNNGGNWFGGGAGGGYSGGGGGCGTNSTPDRGGGGGSFISGGATNTSNESGINNSHGYVVIISPDAPTEEPETPTTPTSYTETGTINLNGSSNTYGANVTFDGAIVNGPGKIISSNNITITNTSNIGGGIEIISGGSVLIQNSILGNGVTSLSNSVVIFGNSGLTIEQNSTVNGLSVIFDGETKVISSTYYGALYNAGNNCEISGASISGSVVSNSGLSVVNSNISKGNLPPIFGKPYGFEGDVINGSYLEY